MLREQIFKHEEKRCEHETTYAIKKEKKIDGCTEIFELNILIEYCRQCGNTNVSKMERTYRTNEQRQIKGRSSIVHGRKVTGKRQALCLYIDELTIKRITQKQ